MFVDDSPYHSERERGIDMNEQRCHFIGVMKHEAVSPRYDCTRKGAMREAVACHEQRRIRRKEPDVNEVEDCNVIAEVEEKVMPEALLVDISAKREQIQRLNGICNVDPPKTRVVSIFSRE